MLAHMVVQYDFISIIYENLINPSKILGLKKFTRHIEKYHLERKKKGPQLMGSVKTAVVS